MTTSSPQYPVVRARQLSKSYDDKLVVRSIDLDVPRGGCFGLLGPNGAGKTTILRMILGQSPISSGDLTVLGLPIPESSRQVRQRTGVVPQKDNLDPDFTVIENLTVYASYFGLDPVIIRDRIQSLLEFVALQDRANTKINTLSGGMKRRLSIARALVNDPEFLVLDEPTTGLDPQVRHMIWARLRELKQAGKTLLLTTHYMEEAERLCDDLVIMDHGKILSQGHPKFLIKKHVPPEVVEVHGDIENFDKLISRHTDLKTEIVGETIYCHTSDPSSLLTSLENQPTLTYLHRPANLEDVFLKLTGRELRDE